MSFTIGAAVEVKAEHIVKNSVVLPVIEMGGSKYFNLSKGDHKLERLFVTKKQNSKVRPLTQTTIVETIRSERDKAFWSPIPGRKTCESSHKKPRLSKDDNAKIMLLEDVPEVITIDIPACGTADIKVLLTKPWGDALMVELTVDIIRYISDAVMTQIEATSDQNREDGKRFDNMNITGLSKLHNRNLLRLRVRTDGGALKEKYFKIVDGDDDAAVRAVHRYINDKQTTVNDDGDECPSECSVADQQSNDERE